MFPIAFAFAHVTTPRIPFIDALKTKLPLTSVNQAYTKGAIYRQMQEYSRKASTAESRLEELHKRSVHHDDHLRLIDAWWRQVGLFDA